MTMNAPRQQPRPTADNDAPRVCVGVIAGARGLRREARLAQRMGFTGKTAIHPKQIAPINEIFSPDAETVAQARRIVEAFNADPDGLLVLDGRLVELPVVRAMRRALAIAEKIGLAEARATPDTKGT